MGKGKLSRFDYIILFLSLYVIFELWFSSVFQNSINDNVKTILYYIDFVICLLFIYDFFQKLQQADQKIIYLKYHWIDLIASIPTIGFLRIFRIFRIVRLLRVMLSAKHIINILRKSTSLLNVCLIASFLLCVITALSMFILESGNPNFKTFEECVWWTLFTFTSIGYQDIVPITPEGKLFSLILSVAGVLLFATTIGYVVDLNVEEEEINTRLNSIENKLDQLKKDDDK